MPGAAKALVARGGPDDEDAMDEALGADLTPAELAEIRRTPECDVLLERVFDMTGEQVAEFRRTVQAVRDNAGTLATLDVVRAGLDYLHDLCADAFICTAVVHALIALDFPSLCIQVLYVVRDDLESHAALLHRLMYMVRVFVEDAACHQQMLDANCVALCLRVWRVSYSAECLRSIDLRIASVDALTALLRGTLYTRSKYKELRYMVHRCLFDVLTSGVVCSAVFSLMTVMCSGDQLSQLLFLGWTYRDADTRTVYTWKIIRTLFCRSMLNAPPVFKAKLTVFLEELDATAFFNPDVARALSLRKQDIR